MMTRPKKMISRYVCAYTLVARQPSSTADGARDFAALHREALRATAETARTVAMFDTDAVFHAPMFAVNADA
jgi:hypothetical protein